MNESLIEQTNIYRVLPPTLEVPIHCKTSIINRNS